MTGASTLLDLIMMALGSFRFGINQANYQSLSRTAIYRWEELDRVGREPASQFMGPGSQTIELEGVLHPHYRGGLLQMDAMRAIASTGTPLMLVDGLGFVFRRWVVEEVDERKSVLFGDGAPRQIDFTIALRSYGRDAA